MGHFVVDTIKFKDFLGGALSHALPLLLLLYFGSVALHCPYKVVSKKGPSTPSCRLRGCDTGDMRDFGGLSHPSSNIF